MRSQDSLDLQGSPRFLAGAPVRIFHFALATKIIAYKLGKIEHCLKYRHNVGAGDGHYTEHGRGDSKGFWRTERGERNRGVPAHAYCGRGRTRAPSLRQ